MRGRVGDRMKGGRAGADAELCSYESGWIQRCKTATPDVRFSTPSRNLATSYSASPSRRSQTTRTISSSRT